MSEELFICVRTCFHNTHLFREGETNIPRSRLGKDVPRHFKQVSSPPDQEEILKSVDAGKRSGNFAKDKAEK